MVTMLAIMKDTDDHFAEVVIQLEDLRSRLGEKPKLKLVKPIDKDN